MSFAAPKNGRSLDRRFPKLLCTSSKSVGSGETRSLCATSNGRCGGCVRPSRARSRSVSGGSRELGGSRDAGVAEASVPGERRRSPGPRAPPARHELVPLERRRNLRSARRRKERVHRALERLLHHSRQHFRKVLSVAEERGGGVDFDEQDVPSRIHHEIKAVELEAVVIPERVEAVHHRAHDVAHDVPHPRPYPLHRHSCRYIFRRFVAIPFWLGSLDDRLELVKAELVRILEIAVRLEVLLDGVVREVDALVLEIFRVVLCTARPHVRITVHVHLELARHEHVLPNVKLAPANKERIRYIALHNPWTAV
mmetsp:Transcript_29542/g.96212  ORF Transcript_29542/g.96212 Transcript_29542/m.96212 type:complete len:311 (+) Transcript_29542:391-1323(+)